MPLQQNYQISQKQLHSLVLTQTMKQSLWVLQSNLVDLNEYAKEQSLENPLFDVNPNLSRSEIKLGAAQVSDTTDKSISVYDYLLKQVNLTMRKTKLQQLVIALIDNLDEHGYLLLSDQELQGQLHVSAVELADAKELLFQLDPPGIGAQNLQECLVLQVEEMPNSIINQLTLTILQNYFNELVNHQWQKLAKTLKVDELEVKKAFNVIQKLTPYPFVAAKSTTDFVIPELIVKKTKQGLSLAVTKYGYPNLVFVQETYDNLKNETDQEVKHYLRQKYHAYKSLAENLDHRLTTLSLIGQIILNVQYDHFLDESVPLKPLLLRDVAQKLDLSESTISRAINDKYLQTDAGVFPIKNFFTKRSGQNSDQSVDEILVMIEQLIKQEDTKHPLSDQKISRLLAEQEVKVARRTVAKYRQKLNIASASVRRKG